MTLKEILPLLFTSISIIWLCINEFNKRKKLKIIYAQGFYFKDKYMKTYSEAIITNHSTQPIYIKKIGFLKGNKILPINKSKDNLKNFKNIALEALLENVNAHEVVIDNYFSDTNNILQPGTEMKCNFEFLEIKKAILQSPNSKFYVYCLDQSGKKSKSKVDNKLILSSNEPISNYI